VETPLPPEMFTGEKVQEVLAGNAEHASETGKLNPESAVTDTV
jgi:hypothetical protein